MVISACQPALPLVASLAHRLSALPPVWFFLWGGFVVLTVALVLLMRTRWGHTKPFHKCAILSLWAHVLLACLATTVTVVRGVDGSGDDPAPIRIAVRNDALPERSPPALAEESTPPKPWDLPLASPLPPAATPAWDAKIDAASLPSSHDAIGDTSVDELLADIVSARAETSAEQVSTSDAAAAEAASEPRAPVDDRPPAQLADGVASQAKAKDKPTAQTPDNTRPAANARRDQFEPASTARHAPSHAAGDKPTIWEPTTQPPVPSAFARRFDRHRDELVANEGGGADTEAAVRQALEWLASTQSPDGGWNASQFGAGTERRVLGHDRRQAGARADTGISALAVLAFLGAGHTHTAGDFRTTVRDGLHYLQRRQRHDGALFGDAQFFAQTYCHSMATFAMCEALAITGDDQLAPAARRAVDYCLRAQHVAGGWRYRPGDRGDTSQLGWQMMALRSAELAGLAIPGLVWTRVDGFLRGVARGRQGGLAAYQSQSAASRTMTAEALYCRHLLGFDVQSPQFTAASGEAARYLLGELPGVGPRNFYYWYYATLALHQLQHASPQMKAAWQRWNEALRDELLTTQEDDTPHAGSWAADTVWGGYGGRVYTTALAAMSLEVYYRYAPRGGTTQQAGGRGLLR